MAGIGKMNYKQFMFYNVIGAFIWGFGVTLVGFWAGKVVGRYFSIDKYLLPVILLATFFTFGISFWHILKNPIQRQLLKKKIKKYSRDFFVFFK